MEYYAHGAHASPELVSALIQDKGPWAHAVLSQCFSVPILVRQALFDGEAKWTVPNFRTIVINLPESP
jgi:hypothetical protein